MIPRQNETLEIVHNTGAKKGRCAHIKMHAVLKRSKINPLVTPEKYSIKLYALRMECPLVGAGGGRKGRRGGLRRT